MYYQDPLDEKRKFTLVSVKLVTGKTHQIRVHMQLLNEELGNWPGALAGDFKYLKNQDLAAFKEVIYMNEDI